MRKLFYSKLIYITIMFFFIFTIVLAQSELKMGDPLYQQGKILGRNFKVIYQYFSEEENGEMVFKRGYLHEKIYTDKNKYISEYELLKDELVKEYGKPILDKQEWKDDGYKGMKALWGHAVSKGNRIYLEIHTKTKE
jgi:hypothetical protein